MCKEKKVINVETVLKPHSELYIEKTRNPTMMRTVAA